MSFSGEVKEELSIYLPKARHCQIAEIAAIFGMCGQLERKKQGYYIRIHTENITVARKCFTLLQKTFNIKADMCVRRNAYLKKNRTYIIIVANQHEVQKILETIKIEDENGKITENDKIADQRILQSSCCRRAFVRGAFLASGSISDPEKFYHLEIVCTSQKKAEQMREIMNSFPVEAKIVRRKKYYVVYIKEGEQIGEMLRVMEASLAVMNLENIRIVKEMRNSINRQVNCETANIHKTVSAAIEQINDINYIREYVGFDNLPENLREIALARLERPEATLKELGDSLSPPVGKSGVNHRLRKLKMIADKSREKKEEDL